MGRERGEDLGGGGILKKKKEKKKKKKNKKTQTNKKCWPYFLSPHLTLYYITWLKLLHTSSSYNA